MVQLNMGPFFPFFKIDYFLFKFFLFINGPCEKFEKPFGLLFVTFKILNNKAQTQVINLLGLQWVRWV